MKKEFPDGIKMPETHSLDSDICLREENGNCQVVQVNCVPGNDSGKQRSKHKENLKLISKDNFGKSCIYICTMDLVYHRLML